MQAEQSILDKIQGRQHKWKIVVGQWIPHGRRRRGRPEQSWKNQNDGFQENQKHGRRYGKCGHLWCLGMNR